MSIRRDVDYEALDCWEDEESTDTLAYIGSLPELIEAGLGGFSIRHIDQMPEHESDFIPAPSLCMSDVDRDACAVEQLFAEDKQRRLLL